mgnify:CR=1 FL=1
MLAAFVCAPSHVPMSVSVYDCAPQPFCSAALDDVRITITDCSSDGETVYSGRASDMQVRVISRDLPSFHDLR